MRRDHDQQCERRHGQCERGFACGKGQLRSGHLRGTILVSRILAGSLNFTDVSCSLPGFRFVDSLGTPTGPIGIGFNRCFFQNGAGNYIAQATVGTPFPITLTGTNTIWQGTGSVESSILALSTSAPTSSTMVLNQCTFYGAPSGFQPTLVNVNVSADNVTPTANGDTLTANYTIFDGTGTIILGKGVLDSGITNCIVEGTFAWGYPPGQIIGTPLGLGLDGRIAAPGRPSDSANASASIVDVDGNIRPQGGGKDVGASEAAFSYAPVSVSALSVE